MCCLEERVKAYIWQVIAWIYYFIAVCFFCDFVSLSTKLYYYSCIIDIWARKPTLLTLRKVLTLISLSMPRSLTRIDTFRVDFLFQESLLYTSIPLRLNVSALISLRGLRRLIWVDTLRKAIMVFFSRDGSFLQYHAHNTRSVSSV